MESYLVDSGYSADADEVGIVTAVEQSTGSKQNIFKGFGRGISVPTYQWAIVVGAVALLWAMGYSLRGVK